jgi:DNA-binding transcriptional ArsR family regulator
MPISGDDLPEQNTTVRFSYVVELIMAATLATNRPSSLSGFDENWQRAQYALLPASARAFIERTRAFSCPTLSVIDFVTMSSEFDDVDRFFAVVRSASPAEFLRVLLNSDLPLAVVTDCLANPAAAAAHVGRLSYFSRMPAEDLVSLFSDPLGFREELLDFLAANRTSVFEDRVKETASRYAERSREIRDRLTKTHPLALAEELKKRPFTRHPFQRYTFVPSYFEGYMSITSDDGKNFLFLFNVFPGSGGGTAEGDLVADRLRVLADRSRLEILRQLVSGPSYCTEIAVRLKLTTATVSRHLDQLKKAGLVIEEKADSQNVKLVRVDRTAVANLFDTAQRYLGECRADTIS